jgi:hypothetical protein
MTGTANPNTGADENTELSEQYETPMGLAHTTMQALKDRIKLHYDLASDYYLNLWYVVLFNFLFRHPTPSSSEPCAGTGENHKIKGRTHSPRLLAYRGV